MKNKAKQNNNRNYLLIGVIALACIGLVFGYFNLNDKSNNDRTSEGYKTIDSEEFNQIAKSQDAFLLDVHIPEQAHIPGTDAFIPYNEIDKNLDQLPKDKNTPILVYCRSGSMSKIASDDLINLGYKNVYDLSGGTDLYKNSNQIVEVSPKTSDLGTVIYGEIPTTTLTFTNYTSDSIEITRVSTSCECTSAEVAKTELAPYESTEVEVSFNPAIHGDDTDLGDITRTIYLDTDSKDYPQVTANITANVIRE